MRNLLYICSILLTTVALTSQESSSNEDLTKLDQVVVGQQKSMSNESSTKHSKKHSKKYLEKATNDTSMLGLDSVSKKVTQSDVKSAAKKQSTTETQFNRGSGSDTSAISPSEDSFDIQKSHDSEEIDYKAKLQTMAIYVLIFIIAILLMTYVLRKFSSHNIASQNASMNLKILEKRVLSSKSVLYLVEMEGSRVLVGESQVELTMHAVSTPTSMPK